ncbi:MAG: hypothetical protein J7502_15760 [Flavisolibacter sp.]|nr:hypothetical protein [Flavisolibacter sp.]
MNYKNQILLLIILLSVCKTQAQTNSFPSSGNVGIGATNPDVHLQIVEYAESRPGGNTAPTKSVLKFTRVGTPDYAWTESAEFRIGHGGPSAWGSKLDLFVNGASNQSNIPDQQVMTWQYNGNVGIGTDNPRALLDVGKPGGGGLLGSVLSRLPEGNSYGEGTFLGVRSWETKVAGYGDSYGGKSFSIEHSFYGKINSAINFHRGDSEDGGWISFSTYNGAEKMRLDRNGNLGIGIINPQNKLDVNGKVHAKEVKVDMTGWSDYVLKKDYKRLPLEEVEKHIEQKGTLPGIPTEAAVIKDGIELGEMNKKLLAKIEELTLYVIDLKKQLDAQDAKIKRLTSAPGKR